MRVALDSCEQGILIAGSDGTVRYVNEAFRRLEPAVETAALGAVRNGQDACGRIGGADWKVIRFGDEWVVCAKRLDESEALREKIRAQTKELEGFLYTVSHDFRAPLRAIMSSSMFLIEDFADQLGRDGKAELDRQSNAAKKLGALMDEILKLSRLSRQEMVPERIDLTALTRDVASEIARTASMPPEIVVADGLEAYADPRMARQLLSTLLENAVKFAKPGESARIKVGQDADGFFVQDQGIGVRPEKTNDIFGVFTRLNGEEYPGMGVGLTTAKRIVDRHNGQISADGNVDEGLTVRFAFGTA